MTFTNASTGFQNPVIAGSGELVIDDIHSRGYTPGVQGWSIDRNGSAEFNNVDIRGRVEIGPVNGSQVIIDRQVGPPVAGFIQLPTHGFSELNPAHILTSLFNTGLPNEAGSLAIRGPQSVGATDRLGFVLNAQNNDASSAANYLLNIPGGQSIMFGDKNDFNLRLNNNFVVRNPTAGPINIFQVNANTITLDADVVDLSATKDTTWAPGWSTGGLPPAFGNANIQSDWWNFGQFAYFRLRIIWGATTNFGTGLWSFSLPFTPVNLTQTVTALAATGGALRYPGVALITASAGAQLNRISFAPGGSSGATNNNPFAWAAGDLLSIQGWVEKV